MASFLMTGSVWESIGPLLTVVTPLVAIPLTVITFYLRCLRDHQRCLHADMVRRVEAVEHAARDLRRMLGDVERDYTTKEEWLREHVHARRVLEHLTEAVTRIDATVSGFTRRAPRGPMADGPPEAAAVCEPPAPPRAALQQDPD